jgi:hypothetical protein
MKLGLITAVVMSLFLYAPSSLAQSAQPPELDSAYCESLGEGHPDEERCEDLGMERTVASTMLGASAGALTGALAGSAICLFESNQPICIGVGIVAGATLGGYSGFKSVVLTIGGGIVGGAVGLMFEDGLILVGAPVGGYLGYRWSKRVRPSATQVSVSPYIHSEGSGLMFSGRF